MRAFVVKELSHPSKISVALGIPKPILGPQQILVDVYSAGLNFFDVMLPANCNCRLLNSS
jgi:NADPH2:quinone reductase